MVRRRRGKPPHEALGILPSVALPGAGSVLIGRKGSLHHSARRHAAAVAGGEVRGLQDSEKVASVDHYVSWADACRGEGKTTSHFDYAGPLTEAVLLGTVAIRTPHETLQWDAAGLKIANSPEANALLTKTISDGLGSEVELIDRGARRGGRSLKGDRGIRRR